MPVAKKATATKPEPEGPDHARILNELLQDLNKVRAYDPEQIGAYIDGLVTAYTRRTQ